MHLVLQLGSKTCPHTPGERFLAQTIEIFHIDLPRGYKIMWKTFKKPVGQDPAKTLSKIEHFDVTKRFKTQQNTSLMCATNELIRLCVPFTAHTGLSSSPTHHSQTSLTVKMHTAGSHTSPKHTNAV